MNGSGSGGPELATFTLDKDAEFLIFGLILGGDCSPPGKAQFQMLGEIFDQSIKDEEGIQEKLQIKLAGDAHAQWDFFGRHVLMGLQEFGNHFMIVL